MKNNPTAPSGHVGSGDLLGSVVRGRAEWLDLLHKCQNGDATCLFVLKEMEAEMERENARLRASLGAIHWNASRSDVDRVVLASIKEECEHAIPELKSILANAQGEPSVDTFLP